MKIEVITMWYNESYLSRFFLKHYSFADKIHIIIDTDTDDDTLNICSKYNNVEIDSIKFPDKFDDEIKINKINSVYKKLDCDWAIVVDSDEFVFPMPLGSDIKEKLAIESEYDVILSRMWQVYRHRTDADLDYNLPVITQRRHGDPNVSEGVNRLYTKPIIVKGGLDISWEPGCHALSKSHNFIKKRINKLIGFPKISPTIFAGVHWAMADPQYVIERRIHGRKDRFSKNNRDKNLSWHLLDITEESLMHECESHMDDPQLF